MITNYSTLEDIAYRNSYATHDYQLCEIAKAILTLRERFINLRLDQMRGVTDDFSYDYDTDTFTISNKINNE